MSIKAKGRIVVIPGDDTIFLTQLREADRFVWVTSGCMETVAPHFKNALREYPAGAMSNGFSSEMRNDYVIPVELMQ